MKAMLTWFPALLIYNVSHKGERTTMAEGEESKENELEGRGDNLYEDRACLWSLAHQDYMNGNKVVVAYCQVDAQMSEKYTITRDNYKIKWTQIGNHSSPDFLGSLLIILHKRDPLFF